MSDPHEPTAPTLARALYEHALPAYFAPLVMSFGASLLLDDARLARASYTSIAPPSLVAAALIVLVARTGFGTRFRHRSVPAAAMLAFAGFYALTALGVALGEVFSAGVSMTFSEAPLSAAIGGAVATTTTLRDFARRASMPLVVLSLSMMVLTACGAAPRPPTAHAGRPARATSRVVPGVRAETWATFTAITATCGHWAELAEADAASHRARQRRAGIVSTVAGVLGTASGITGGALASVAHDDGDDDAAFVRSLAGGVTAMGFGLVATTAGLMTSAAGRASGEASGVAAAIDEALAHHTIAALGAIDPASREADVVREGTRLARVCVLHASRAESTASLGVPATSGLEMRRVANVLIDMRDERSTDETFGARLFLTVTP